MHKYINQITSTTHLSRQEAIWLLEHIANCKPLPSTLQLTQEQSQHLTTALDEIRLQHKPLAYVIGWVPFLDLKLHVQPPILIPRPETEEWVHQLITQLTPYKDSFSRILDVGTGSGAIALALAKSFNHAQITAVDINPASLALTQRNAQANNITNITCVHSDLFAALEGQTFDLIVSNPPYIPHAAQANINPSVLNWEDHQALFAQDNGTKLIADIMHQAPKYLRYNHTLPFQLVIEIDYTHDQIAADIAHQNGLNCTIKNDIFGNIRTAWCTIKI